MGLYSPGQTSSVYEVLHNLCLMWLCESTSVSQDTSSSSLVYSFWRNSSLEPEGRFSLSSAEEGTFVLFIYFSSFLTNSSRLYEAAVISSPQSLHLLLHFASLCSSSSSFLSLVLHLHLVARWPVSTQESCVCVRHCESPRRYPPPEKQLFPSEPEQEKQLLLHREFNLTFCCFWAIGRLSLSLFSFTPDVNWSLLPHQKHKNSTRWDDETSGLCGAMRSRASSFDVSTQF